MNSRYWLFQRNGMFYYEDTEKRKQVSLRTRDRREAERQSWRNLSSVLRRSLKGDDIGLVVEGKIVALGSVEVVSRD